MFPIERTTSFHSPSGIKNTGGQCRGRGGGVGFLEGFPEDAATYRKERPSENVLTVKVKIDVHSTKY